MVRKGGASDERAPPSNTASSEQLAWERLLDFIACEGADPQDAYRRMRERLLKFFAWRGSSNAEELTDEALTRVAARLLEGEVRAERPAAFIIGVARMIDLEGKRRERRWVPFDESIGADEPPPTSESQRLERKRRLRRAAGLRTSSSGLSACTGNGIARRLMICL